VSKNLGQNSEKCGTVFQSTVHTCIHKNHHVWTGKKCAGPKSLLTSWFSSLIAFSFYLLMRARRYCFSRGASLFWGKQVCLLFLEACSLLSHQIIPTGKMFFSHPFCLYSYICQKKLSNSSGHCLEGLHLITTFDIFKQSCFA